MNSISHDWLLDRSVDDRKSQTTNFTSKSETTEATPITALQLTLRAAETVNQAESAREGAHQTHAEMIRNELAVRAQQLVKSAPAGLLTDIGEMGFAWRDVARALGVSVPAVQKWRRGEGLSGESRLKLAQFIAGIDMVAAQLVDDVASWFETPVSEEAPVSPMDLWADGERVLVLRYASDHLTGEQALEEWDSEWRARWQSAFVAVRAEDGQMSIARKGSDG